MQDATAIITLLLGAVVSYILFRRANLEAKRRSGLAEPASKSGNFSRLLRLLVFTGVAVYVVICVFMAVYQRHLIYFPQVLTPEAVDQQARAAGLERWTNAAGQNIGLKRPSPKQPAAGSVLVVYGNGSYAAGCAHYADDLQKVVAFDIFILEYPGYADRPGSPSQNSLFHAADEAFQMMPANRPVYLLGESLGTGVAAYLTGAHPDKVAGVILLSPFDHLTSVAQSQYPFLPVPLLLLDRFPSADYLHSYHGPIGITVGGRDTVVPKKFGLRLYDSYTGPKKLWEFPQGQHTEIAMPPEVFWKEAIEFWQTNRSTSL
jgi:pimeloyl-ACP methyl ester carboxylesterase